MAKKDSKPDQHAPLTVTSDGIDVYCAHTQLVETDKLVENPRNPNTHPPEQIKALARVISVQGWRQPITVSTRSGFIIKGHGRLQAAKQLNATQVPVDYQAYADEASEWADMVADNRIAELSSMDNTVLRELMKELDAMGGDLELTGYSEAEINRLMDEIDTFDPEKADAAPVLPDVGIEGETGGNGRLIIVYEEDEERELIMRLLGIDPSDSRVLFSTADIPALEGKLG